MSFTTYFFSFSGRINRAKLWLFVAIVFGVEIAFMIAFVSLVGVAALTGAAKAPNLAASGFTAILIALLSIPTLVVLIIGGISLAIRRLHDRAKSGWWLVVFWLIPFVLNGTSVAMQFRNGGPLPEASVMSLAALALTIWAFVELYCLRGTAGENQYGPDPLDHFAPARVFE